MNGVATFDNFRPTRAGTFTLKASDDCLTAAVSDDFTVAAASASKLVCTQAPCNARHGSKFDVQVSVEDQYGNVCTSDDSTITLSLSKKPKNGVLSGVVSETAVDGVAMFSGLSVNVSGDYSLTAASSEAGVKGEQIDVNVG
jgi:hypothetical protein